MRMILYLLVFAVIMVIFYYQLGQALERTWGTFRFNVYIFGGIIFTVIGAFILYGVMYAVYGVPVAVTQVQAGSRVFSVCTPYVTDD